MFDPTTEDLWLEVQAATKETDEHLEVCGDIVRRMCGRWYRRDAQGQEPMPENFGYAFMSNMLPQLASDEPQVEIEAARVIGHKTVAQAMKDGLNAWISDERFAERHAAVHVDFLISRGVTLHYLDEDARFSRGVVTPRVKRIAPQQFFADSLADGPETDEFRGHWYWVDIDDLTADPDIKADVLEKIVPSGGGGEDDGGEASHYEKPSGGELGRQRLKCYSVWIRATNTIRVLCETSMITEIKEPVAWYGPPNGPYQLYDAYPVPGQHWPLSPMVAVEDQNQDLNIHARAMGRAAARRKSIGLVEASNPDLGAKLTNADDGEILPVKGITGQHVVIELGGVTQEAYTYTEYARNRLDRISGLTATIQGNVGAADTATEAKIADDALSNRVGYLKKKVRTGSEDSLWRMGWYLFHTEGIVIPVNRRDPYSGEEVEGLFFGGPSPDDREAQWDDFTIKVKMNTMQRELNAQENLLGFYQAFIGVAQAAPAMPWVRWMNVLRDLAAAYRVPEKADEWMIPELFGAFGQPPLAPPSMVMGGRQTPQQGGQQQPGAVPTQGPPGSEGFADPNSSPNNFTQAGNVGGPRPRQGQNAMSMA